MLDEINPGALSVALDSFDEGRAMPFYESEALALRSYDLAEADKIVVLFTQRFGKVRVVAPGARRTRSRFGSCFEPLTYLKLDYYQKEGAELGRATQADILYSPYTSGCRFHKAVYCSYFCELINEFTEAHDANDRIFRLALATLQTLDPHDDSESLVPYAERLARYFETWMLKLEGFWPTFSLCGRCQSRTEGEPVRYFIEESVVLCRRCAEKGGLVISYNAQALLKDIVLQHPAEFAQELTNGSQLREVERITQRLITYHLNHKLKAYYPIKRMIKGA